MDFRGKKVRLLLADDSQAFREGLSDFLKRKNFHVVGQASDGMEALSLSNQLKPDVIIMDVNMPVLDGIEATRHIKRKFPYVEVIAYSMQNDKDVIDDMMQAGAFTCLAKDSKPSKLVESIQAAAVG